MNRKTAILLALICAFFSPVLITIMVLQACFGSVERSHNMALAVDMTGNAMFGGDPRMTISGRTGNGVILGYRWAKILAPIIDSIFGASHCADSATISTPNRPIP